MVKRERPWGRRKLKVRVSGFRVVSLALDNAIQAAMNKTDKYTEERLTEAQRRLLADHLPNYFWCEMDEAGAEIE